MWLMPETPTGRESRLDEAARRRTLRVR
jgi:hypothetical protein